MYRIVLSLCIFTGLFASCRCCWGGSYDDGDWKPEPETAPITKAPESTMTTANIRAAKTMKAVGFYKYLPIENAESLLDLDLPYPTLQSTDVLVKVRASGVNLIDTKTRASKPEGPTPRFPRILGWDGSGIIANKGNSTYFEVGDPVFFTADLSRNGTNAQYVAIDELLVGKKPKSLNFSEAAAMPLSTLTAYEALFDRLRLSKMDHDKTLLIINCGEGVGSAATQLADYLGLYVIGTVARPETVDFCFEYGADLVLNHTIDLLPQLRSHGIIGYGSSTARLDYILVNYDPYPHWNTLTKAVKAQGRICLLVESSGLVDPLLLKEKSLTVVFETLLTRLRYNTKDKYRYRKIFERITYMFEAGILESELNETMSMSPINAKNLKEAHRLIEEGQVIGKIVVSGFEGELEDEWEYNDNGTIVP